MLTVDFKTLNLKARDRVLDLGCGRGRHLHALDSQGQGVPFGLDSNFDDVKATRSGYELVGGPKKSTLRLAVGDIRDLPFADGVFDAVICAEVLEHIRDYRRALFEIARIVKPGGRLAVSVPRAWTEAICWYLARGYRTAPGGHVRIFHKRALVADIAAAGFRHVGTRHAHGLHSPYWWLQCAVWDRRETSLLVRAYHRFLVWDMMKRPLLTRALSKLADPLLGKSVVLSFTKRVVPA